MDGGSSAHARPIFYVGEPRGPVEDVPSDVPSGVKEVRKD